MNWKHLFLGLLIGIIIGFLLKPAGSEAPLEELKQQVLRLEEENRALRGWLQGNITLYQKKIALYKEEIDVLRSRINRMDVSILGIYFSPRGGCESQVIEWIGRANSSIHVLIYSFTLDSVSEALIEAQSRGVEVKVVCEKSQITRYSEYQRLKAAGIQVRNDTNSAYMHDKVMIIDGIIVLTGSFNWSAHAERENNENLIVIRSVYVASVYEEEFDRIWNRSI